ncbi:hypothetical protein IVB69_03055 [Flavobacterium sp. J49]|uniref:hypothetical protein n=1 Tax=Flavobacterium sp. J49 TaxID=2718534 RepID=UPI001594C5F7|nr:hypothetical protein [Flavobacterium sp. J49]MBF6640451.1 hypothetical protein [Flavobacterium sp. J49]NIC01698.1 hypothetical protein [Flavobacterium sp. J49]
MKKSANTTNYSIYSQEITNHFLAFTSPFLRQKSDPTALCSPITFLFQEKLPIIYANIRV